MEMPKQLQEPEFRFCLVKSKTKIPFEKDWTKTKNYAFNSKRLEGHLRLNGNIGIIGGYGNLRILDIDDLSLKDEFLSKLKTFTIKTGSGGLHFYFKSDYDQNHVLKEGAGELRAHNYQAVCPPSIHPNGNAYEVFRNLPIIELTKDKVSDLIGPYLRYSNEQRAEVQEEKPKDESRSGKEYREVIRLIALGKKKAEIWNEMGAFTKWANGSEQYRELTFKKAFVYLSKNEEAKGNFYDEKGKLRITALVKHLEKKFRFASVGDKRPELYVYQKGIYSEAGHRRIYPLLEKLTDGKISNNQVSEVMGHLRRRHVKPLEFLNNAPNNLIPVENGVLDLKKGQLTDFKEAKAWNYGFTNKIPVNFVYGAECPAIETFLDEVLSEEDKVLVLEYLGFCLWRSYFLKRALLCFGPRDTGKTTLVNLFTKFIGKENVSAETLHALARNRFAPANLFGKYLNASDDLSASEINDVSNFKKATGQSPLNKEKKFGDSEPFVNFAKLFFTTNRISGVRDNGDDAFFSRWLLVHMDYEAKEKNPDLLKELTTEKELSGLLNLALKGLKRLLQNKSFTYEKTDEDNKLIMLRDSSSIGAFALDVLEEDNNTEVTKEDMFSAYQDYCQEKNLYAESKLNLSRLLPRKAPFIRDKKSGSVRLWNNVKLRGAWDTFNKIIYSIKKYDNNTKNNDNNTILNRTYDILKPSQASQTLSEQTLLEETGQDYKKHAKEGT